MKGHFKSAYCPMCRENIKIIKPGLNNCLYRIEGLKADPRQNNVQYAKPWTEVGNYYMTYDEAEAGITTWQYLYMVRIGALRYLYMALKINAPSSAASL